ncbi:2'-5' RNA ligase family protein [Herbiconiux daphne]|uniref:2'-5' RNA ligase family protein n=1 Tax=Herbiconiux daphne TaxID=2970914 RepID=A0ABT2H0P6_9MICO|nr:2'-5' RNA ligase family protein [Herbiconiux daphne]MCS5733492.1 2'-5' RNA ligase family protein [Herbiconiux daphne]
MESTAHRTAPVVSLELVLDAATEALVRDEWQALADAGLSSLAAHRAASNRPHITLMVRRTIAPLKAAQLAEVVSLPLPIALGPVVLFGTGDRRVLARTIVPSAALLRLHADLHALVGPGAGLGDDDAPGPDTYTPAPGTGAPGPGPDAPHTRPGEWTPHVTLARRLRVEVLPLALSLLHDPRAEAQDAPEARQPHHGEQTHRAHQAHQPRARSTAVALRRWDAASATVTELL